MKVRAQFFSRLRDIVGAASLEFDLSDEGATVRDLLTKIYAEFPELVKWDAHILTAVGVEYVGREQALKPDDTVAIMPPVQGG